MANYIEKRTVRSVLCGFVVGFVGANASQAVGQWQVDVSSNADTRIRAKFPELPNALSPIDSSNCGAHAQAYAAALLAIEDAEEVAGAAYQAWYECENGGGMMVEGNQRDILGPQYSVIVKCK